MMRLTRLGVLALLLVLGSFAAPAEAIQIDELALNCAGTWLEPGVVLTSVSCQGQGIQLAARLSGWPVDTAPITRFALTLDGVLAAEDVRVLPTDLTVAAGPCPSCPEGHYTGIGMGWRLPLDDCCVGRVVEAPGSLDVLGEGHADVAFTLALPTPEPVTMVLLGGTLAAGWVAKRRRGAPA
jgi:hypothetical protein